MPAEKPNTDEIDRNEGALVVIGPRVYFVPRAELRTFRVPDEVAKATLAELDERPILRRGHPNDGLVLGAELDPDGLAMGMSSLYEHALTASTFH